MRRSAPCAPAPRRQRHPPLRPSLRLLRAPSPRKGRDERASRALALRSALRALPLLRLPPRGSSCSAPCFAAVLALLYTPLWSPHAVPPVVAFRRSAPRRGALTPPPYGGLRSAEGVTRPPTNERARSVRTAGLPPPHPAYQGGERQCPRGAILFRLRNLQAQPLDRRNRNTCPRRIIRYVSKCRG